MQTIHPIAQGAHAWLRGHSDGWFGKPAEGWQRTAHPKQYDAGHARGIERRAYTARTGLGL